MPPVSISRRTLLKASLLGSGAVFTGRVHWEATANVPRAQDRECRSGPPILVKACLNGGRTRANHPRVPLSADETAAAAKEAVIAGARALHIHVRSPSGSQSIEPADVARILTAVRTAVPGTPAGISTVSSIQSDPEVRHKTVAAWTVLPDYCSVNIREPGSLRLAELLLSRGVGVEAGLNEAHHVQVLVSAGLAPKCVRMLLEPHGSSTADSLRLANEIEAALDRAASRVRRLFHGSGDTAWPFMDIAIARGYDIRVGIEDMLTLPGDATPASNGMLVAEAVRRVRAAC